MSPTDLDKKYTEAVHQKTKDRLAKIEEEGRRLLKLGYKIKDLTIVEFQEDGTVAVWPKSLVQAGHEEAVKADSPVNQSAFQKFRVVLDGGGGASFPDFPNGIVLANGETLKMCGDEAWIEPAGTESDRPLPQPPPLILHWTDKRPTKPGWYWYRLSPKETPQIAQVSEGGLTPGLAVRTPGITGWVKLVLVDYQWSDAPIHEPLTPLTN